MATVRPGRPADGPRLREIQAAALAEPWPGILEVALDPGGPLLLVVETDEPAGYAVAIVADGTAYVPEVAVDPAEQGRGLGSRLVEALCARLADRGVERVRLTARERDEGVRRFYERLGFAVVRRAPDHFEAGDGLVYERRLGDDAG